MSHDPLCMPGLKGDDSSMCPWCCVIRTARAEERELAANIIDSFLVGLTEVSRRLRKETPIANR